MKLVRLWFVVYLGAVSRALPFSTHAPVTEDSITGTRMPNELSIPSNWVELVTGRPPVPRRGDPASDRARNDTRAGEPAWCPTVRSNLESVNLSKASSALITDISNIVHPPGKKAVIRLREFHGIDTSRPCLERLARPGEYVQVLYEASLAKIHYHLDAIRTISVELRTPRNPVLEMGLAGWAWHDPPEGCQADHYLLFAQSSAQADTQSEVAVFNLTDAWHELYHLELQYILAHSSELYLYTTHRRRSQRSSMREDTTQGSRGSARGRRIHDVVSLTFAHPEPLRKPAMCVVQGHPITLKSPLSAFQTCDHTGVTVRVHLQGMLRSVFGLKLKVEPSAIQLTYEPAKCALLRNEKKLAMELQRLYRTSQLADDPQDAFSRLAADQLPFLTRDNFHSYFFYHQCCFPVQAFSVNVTASFYDVLKEKRVKHHRNYSFGKPSCIESRLEKGEQFESICEKHRMSMESSDRTTGPVRLSPSPPPGETAEETGSATSTITLAK